MWRSRRETGHKSNEFVLDLVRRLQLHLDAKLQCTDYSESSTLFSTDETSHHLCEGLHISALSPGSPFEKAFSWLLSFHQDQVRIKLPQTE